MIHVSRVAQGVAIGRAWAPKLSLTFRLPLRITI